MLSLKISITVILSLLFTTIASAQKKSNSKIGTKEIQVTALYFNDYRAFNSSDAIGIETVYRVAWKQSTKVGVGGLFIYNAQWFLTEGRCYGALFADITQFAGKRQKWGITAEAGHGIYHLQYEGEDVSSRGFSKMTGGFYYSAFLSYRAIISKKLLLTISPLSWMHRNFRYRYVVEYFSPHSIERYQDVREYNTWAFKIGLVF